MTAGVRHCSHSRCAKLSRALTAPTLQIDAATSQMYVSYIPYCDVQTDPIDQSCTVPILFQSPRIASNLSA